MFFLVTKIWSGYYVSVYLYEFTPEICLSVLKRSLFQLRIMFFIVPHNPIDVMRDLLAL